MAYHLFFLQCTGPREKRAVNGIDDRLSADLSPAEESAVEALYGVLAALDLVEFEVDVALGVGIEGDVDDLAVFFRALGADVVFKFFDPGFAFFSSCLLVAGQRRVRSRWQGEAADKFQEGDRGKGEEGEGGNKRGAYSAGLNMLRSRTQRLAWLTLTGKGLFSVFGLATFRLSSAPLVSAAGSSVLASFLIKASLL